MNKFKMMMYRFLQGRYGKDDLNNFLFLLSIVLYVINVFFVNNLVLVLISQLLLIIMLYRTLSRNWAARQSENFRFMNSTKKVRRFLICLQKQFKDKEHAYFLCPTCSQIVRVPKGKGKIECTCPMCKTKFDRKT